MDNTLRLFFFSISAFHIPFSMKVWVNISLYWEIKFFCLLVGLFFNTARNVVKFSIVLLICSRFFFVIIVVLFLSSCFFSKQKSNEKARIYYIVINGDEERVIILCYERVYCHIIVHQNYSWLLLCLNILSAVGLWFWWC